VVASQSPMLTVVAYTFPPRVAATAIVMNNLLSSYSGPISAISGHELNSTYDSTFVPPCQTEYLTLPKMFPRGYERVRRRWPAVNRSLVQESIEKALRRLGAKVVMGVFPYDDFLVATFLAAQNLNLPFYAYIHDLWVETLPPKTSRWRFANKWEPIVFNNADRVICMTEAAQHHYQKKYDLKTDLLPHCNHENDCREMPRVMSMPKKKNPTVLFVGGINPKFNLDALRVLARSTEYWPAHYNLILSTSLSLEKVNALGITSPKLTIQYVPRSEVVNYQSGVHVLIAPVSHKNCAEEEVRTIFSTKLLAYMLSGRPIIAFAPQDSYLAESARKKGWAYVVSEDSPRSLAEAIVKVVEDSRLANELVLSAFQEAQSRDAKRHALRLQEWVEKDIKKSAKLANQI